MFSIEEMYGWICEHPGVDAEDVSKHFEINVMDACDMVEVLLNRGLLDFAD